jgi:hypothetical protein
MCAQLGHAFDTKGCFNKTLQASRVNAKTIGNSNGCFASGQWLKDSNMISDIGDLKSNNATFVFTK